MEDFFIRVKSVFKHIRTDNCLKNLRNLLPCQAR